MLKNIKNKTIKKLNSNSGESIAEALVAVLVVSAAVLMFSGAVVASKNMMTASDTYFESYFNCKNTYESGVAEENTTIEYADDTVQIMRTSAEGYLSLAGETIDVKEKEITSDTISLKEVLVDDSGD